MAKIALLLVSFHAVKCPLHLLKLQHTRVLDTDRNAPVESATLETWLRLHCPSSLFVLVNCPTQRLKLQWTRGLAQREILQLNLLHWKHDLRVHYSLSLFVLVLVSSSFNQENSLTQEVQMSMLPLYLSLMVWSPWIAATWLPHLWSCWSRQRMPTLFHPSSVYRSDCERNRTKKKGKKGLFLCQITFLATMHGLQHNN